METKSDIFQTGDYILHKTEDNVHLNSGWFEGLVTEGMPEIYPTLVLIRLDGNPYSVDMREDDIIRHGVAVKRWPY